MTKASKTTIMVLLLVAILMAGGIAAYVAARKIVPTVLSANLESILSDTTGQPVAIGKTAVRFFPGIIITIRNVTVGTQAKPLLSAHRVEVRLSLWQALFGRVRISHVDLENPVIHVDYEALRKFKIKEESGEAPPVDIHDGVVNLPGREGRLVIEAINGLIEHDGASLEAMVLGGKTRLKATHTDTGWKGSLSSSEMDLAHVSPTLGGVFGVHLKFDLSGNRTASVMSIIGEHLRLPWSPKEIPTFMVRLGAKGNEQALSFDEISVMTPLVKVTGSGIIRDIMKGTGATIALNLKSSMFEYEKVLAFVPVKDFDPWLTELLTSQVKGGMSRFSEARYEGTIQELITFDKFLDHIHVVEDIMGQSFASRPGMERVTGITGAAVFSHGDISIRNLRGHMRGSIINRLDISFPGIMRAYWVVDVGIALDMQARDFFDTWNAAGVPRYVVDLFPDISHTQAGRIRGQARFYWNQGTGRPVQAKGRVDLENCAYTWGTQAVTAHSGSVVWADYGAPMEITSQANIGSHAVKSLSIVMADPFKTMQSSFAACVEGIVASDSFSMGKGTTALIKGTATGLNINASAEISSESISLFDTVFRMKDKPITFKARAKGPLAPKLSLSISGEATGISPGSFAMTGSFDGQQTRVKLKGGLPLDKFVVIQARKSVPLSGRIYADLDILSAKSTAVNGPLVFKNALIPLSDTPFKISGRVNLSGSMLSGDRIKVAKGTLKFAANDWSLDLSGKPEFKGDVAADGLSLPLPKGEGGTPKGFNDFSAQGHLTITNLDFYGNPVENAQADVSLKGGVANLTSIHLQGKSVQATGTMVLDATTVRTFDTEFSFKGVSIARFLENISPDQDWIHGNMDIDGRLYGTPASLNGKVKMVAKNGNLRRYALFSRVFAVLNVYKIIKNRDFELTSKNFPYNKIDWTFTIKDSLLHFDDLFFDSNSLQFSAVGDYNLNTRVMDAVMGIQPFETIDKVIHSIPLIGWVLTGDKGQFLIVSLKVSGNINDPSVQVQPWKTVSDPVKNSLVRALKLPSEIYKDSRKFLSNSKDKKDKTD